MTNKIFQKIKKYCMQENLLQNGDGVVAGVSGGADSVFLLCALKYLQKSMGIKICVVHVNHGIRGEEALQDQQYTQELCKQAGVECVVFQADIPALAKKQKMSEEEAGRTYRYTCFEKVRKEYGYQKIAVAHHKDDQAETILFQLVRGSGVRGMGGMRPRRECIIRPLLDVSRAEIEQVLGEKNIAYCTDSTNALACYARNGIRHHVIPYLQEHIQREAVSHICNTGDILREVGDYLEGQVKKVFQGMVCVQGSVCTVQEADFFRQPAIIQKELIFLMMETLAGKRKDITHEHIRLVLQVFAGETGKTVSLSYGLEAEKSYGTLIVQKKTTARIETLPYFNEEIQPEKNYTIFFADNIQKEYRFELEDNVKKKHLIDKKNYTKCFDYDRMDSMPVFRYAKDGDFLYLSKDGQKKKLSRIFIDAKVPLIQRKKMPVLAIGQHILWIPQLNRCSAYYYIDENTKTVLLAKEEKHKI